MKGNPEFVKLTSIFKAAGFFVSVIAYVLFRKRTSIISISNRVIEQNLVLKLGLLLIFFNDPLYAFTLYKPSVFMYRI